MTEDISSFLMISLTVYLAAFLLSIVLGVTFLTLQVFRNYSDKLVTVVGGNSYREFIQVASSSKEIPLTGAQVWSLFSDIGFIIDSGTCLDIENGLVKVTSLVGYTSDSEVEILFSRFYKEHADDLYIVDFKEKGTGLFDVTITQVIDGEPVQ